MGERVCKVMRTVIPSSYVLIWVGSTTSSSRSGWGWVVGKSDFNENPVVSLDLDFDLGFVNKMFQKTDL